MKLDKLTTPELYSILINLKPLEDSVLPVAHGHWVYAMFLRILNESTPLLANELHGSDALKPFTVSALQGKAGRFRNTLKLNPGTVYPIRLTFLNGEIFGTFLNSAMKWADKALEIGPATVRMDNISTFARADKAVAYSNYQDILDSASADRHIELEFLSPTAFRSGGKRNVVFPEPKLVFGSSLTKWQAFSAIKIEADVAPYLEKILVSRYRLITRILDFGNYQEIGFTGRCRFELDKTISDEVAVAINALADFALYCGTGAKTTMGMGQTRRAK